MNELIITNTLTGKQYDESMLAELADLLLPYERTMGYAEKPYLIYGRRGWGIIYRLPPMSVSNKLTLDPSKYTVIPRGFIQESKVREMIAEFRHAIDIGSFASEEYECDVFFTRETRYALDSIASKYLNTDRT